MKKGHSNPPRNASRERRWSWRTRSGRRRGRRLWCRRRKRWKSGVGEQDPAGRGRRGAAPRCAPRAGCGTSVGTWPAGCGRRPHHHGPAPVGFLPRDLLGDVPSAQKPWQESVAGGSLISALGGQNGRRCHHRGPFLSPPPASSRKGAGEEVRGDPGAVRHPESGGYVPHLG